MDMPVPQALRMVHRRSQGRGKEGRDGCLRDSYIYYAILPQVRFTYYYAGKVVTYTLERFESFPFRTRNRYRNRGCSFQYICENHFQRLSKKSIFTGLKAINHFGRPDMTSFLKFVQKKHSYVSCVNKTNRNNNESRSTERIKFSNYYNVKSLY